MHFSNEKHSWQVHWQVSLFRLLRKRQIRATAETPSHPRRMAITKVGGPLLPCCGKVSPCSHHVTLQSHALSGDVEWCICYGKVWTFYRNVNSYQINPILSMHHLVHNLENWDLMVTAAFVTVKRKQRKCTSIAEHEKRRTVSPKSSSFSTGSSTTNTSFEHSDKKGCNHIKKI